MNNRPIKQAKLKMSRTRRNCKAVKKKLYHNRNKEAHKNKFSKHHNHKEKRNYFKLEN